MNPYLPGTEHVPDGEPHIFGDRLYVFGSHDLTGAGEYCAGSYVGWSAPVNDLSDWRFEGEIYAKGQDPLDPDGDKIYYAPDVVPGNDGRYYLYYSICNSYVISVARADSPAGPYRYYGKVKNAAGHVIGSSEGDAYQFDPALLNDNGRIYLYSGQGLPVETVGGRVVKGAMVCELSDDMLTVKGEQKIITSRTENPFTENFFFEASSIRRYGDTYYFIYSPLPNTHYLCYATSSRPDGNFTYKGVLVSNADIFPEDPMRQIPLNYWGNNHGSLLELNGEYYIFYHRNTNACPYARQGCVEKITKLPDGSFLQAEVTSLGLAKSAWPAKGTYPAYTACLLQKKNMPAFQPYTFYEYSDKDPFITEDTEGLVFLENLTDMAMCGFRYLDAEGSEKNICVKARCAGGGKLEILANRIHCGEIKLTESPEWTLFKGDISLAPGKNEIRLVYQGEGKADILEFCIT